VDRLADVGQARCFAAKALEPGGERSAALGRVELRRERSNGRTVHVEASARVTACGEDEERPPGGGAQLLVVELDLVAGERRQRHDGDRELLVVAGERLLESL
jgi:hypothetical protein